MGNLSTTIPFTEIYERLMTMGRVDVPNNRDYAKGVTNDVYTKILPRIEDWNPIVKESNLSMSASYKTGTVAITAGSANITGTGTTWTTAMIATDGYKIKISGNDNVYDFTYASATTGTISPALSGATDLSAKTYTIYREEYSLASDFDRLLKNGSIYVLSGGRVNDIIKEDARDVFREDYTPEATDPIRRCMLTRTHSTTGYRLVRLNPPPKTAKVYPYDYIQKVTPMSDYNVGTIAVTNASTAVVGTDTLWSTNMAVGDYIRVDSDGTGDSSIWYKVATVTDNTNIVLSSAYGGETQSGAEYYTSKIPSAFPSEFHEYILYEALTMIVAEQGDTLSSNFFAHKELIMKDLKKNYKSRRTNIQVHVEDGGYRGNYS